MKKILTTISMALIAVAMMAQQPVLSFERTEYDFGKINEADGRVTTIFKFKNDGMAPLVLTNVRASCGCTTPKWTREPIEPGQSGEITVTYNPNGRPGRFQKTITVTSNASEATKRLYIKGEVIPKPAKPTNQYNVSMGSLRLKTKIAYFGSIRKGQRVTQEIEYTNPTNQEVSVELATRDQDYYLLHQITLSKVQPQQTGKLRFILDTKACPIYGPIELYAYVVVNGKTEINDRYKITIKADVLEDFSTLSPTDRQQAPIIDMPSQIDLGQVHAGKKLKANLPIKNSGTNPLLIHRVYSADEHITFSAPKSQKASPKTGNIRVVIDTTEGGEPMQPGKYARQIQVITNDPNHPRHTINLTWTIL